MSKSLMLLVLSIALATLAWSQVENPGIASSNAFTSGAPSTACAYSFSSGSGRTLTQYCLTQNGNIVQFSNPGNVQFFNHETVSEGYGLCDFQSSDPYFDYASNAQGWGPTMVFRPNGKTVRFVRRTLDGKWELTQEITKWRPPLPVRDRQRW